MCPRRVGIRRDPSHEDLIAERQKRAGDEQAEADDDALQERDAEHALGDRADGRRGQVDELPSAVPVGGSLKIERSRARAALAEGDHDAGEAATGCEDLQRPLPMPATKPSGAVARLSIFRGLATTCP